MSKIYLPTSEQMDVTLANLARIAGALGTKENLSTWAGIRKAVKSGVAPQIFPVGTQFTVSHSVYGDMQYDVVAHDYFKSAHNTNAHTMTLISHKSLPSMQFDNPEAFYYAETALSAGTYNFTIPNTFGSWQGGTYQFTLTKSLPKGGQLGIDSYATSDLTQRYVKAYAVRNNTESSETVAIISGSGGTSLGTFGVELNHVHRVSYGSNNYKESAVRQFLNSSAVAGSVWTPQTKFDRPPSWVNSIAGFVNGIDGDFLSVVGEVIVPCSANNVYESPDSTTLVNSDYTVVDKFYLANQVEVFGETDNPRENNTSVFPYYEESVATDRIKYNAEGASSNWWLRSTTVGGAYGTKSVLETGLLDGSRVYTNRGIVPVCTII